MPTMLQEVESIATHLRTVLYPAMQNLKRDLRVKHWPKRDPGGRKRASVRLAFVKAEGRQLARRMDDLVLLDGISRRISEKACRGLRAGNARWGRWLRLSIRPSEVTGANS